MFKEHKVFKALQALRVLRVLLEPQGRLGRKDYKG